MTATYAIVPAAHQAAINAAFIAMNYGGAVFTTPLTTASPALEGSPHTHYSMYNDPANPTEYALLAAAKLGTIPPVGVWGDPVAWGEGGLISEADALVAFASLQIWVNDSERSSTDFITEQRVGLGLSLVPMGI